MGLIKGPFVVVDTVSVDDAYSEAAGSIVLDLGVPTDVATVKVSVKNPHKTQVSLDSMAQIALFAMGSPLSVTFEVTYEILRNGDVIATINYEMDYQAQTLTRGRHTNFPNFPLVDNNPSAGINTYELRVTRVLTNNVLNTFVASRSLKATVFPS